MFVVRVFGLEGSFSNVANLIIWLAMLGGLIAVLQVLPVDRVSPAMPVEETSRSVRF